MKIARLFFTLMCMVCSLGLFSQENTGQLPLYNLFYLSKYITASGLDDSIQTKKEIYNHLMSQMGTANTLDRKSTNNRYILALMDSVEKDREKTVKTKLSSFDFQRNTVNDLIIGVDKGDKISNLFDTIQKKSHNIDTLLQKEETQQKKYGLVLRFKEGYDKIRGLSCEEPIPEPSTLSGEQAPLQEEITVDNLLDKEVIGRLKEIKEVFDKQKTRKNDILKVVVNKDTLDFCFLHWAIDTLILKPHNSTLCMVKECAEWNNSLTETGSQYAKIADALQGSLNQLSEHIKSLSRTKKDSIDVLANLLVEKENKNLILPDFRFVDHLSANQTTAQIHINSMLHTAEQAARPSFRLPSESDLINAMAIFLANRAKQEAIIWFVDRLKEDIHNPLVFDAFPETFALLKNTDSYHAPNFAHSWRYALSKDFVNMPTNLIHSPWIEQVWFKGKDLDGLRDAIRIGDDLIKLIGQQYSYRDIIRYVYLNTPRSKTHGDIREAFSFLYMVVSELYTVDMVDKKPSFRLLTYEELATMNAVQWEVFMELVRIKYDDHVVDKLQKPFEGSLDSKQSDMLRRIRWLSSLLLSLSQFDKTNLAAMANQDGSSPSSGIWKALLQVVEQVDPNFDRSGIADSHIEYVKLFSTVLSIYENIYNKNFDVAIRDVLNFISNYRNQPFSLIGINQQGEITINDQAMSSRQVTIFKGLPKTDFKLTLSLEEKERKRVVCVEKISDNTKGKDTTARFGLDLLRDELRLMNYAINDSKKGNWEKIRTELKEKPQIGDLLSLFGIEIGSNKAYETLLGLKFLVDIFQDPSSVHNNKLFASHIQEDFYKEVHDQNTDRLLKLASFFSDIIYSPDSRALASAIERHALPPTSYITKRKARFTLSLNGYVGGFVGLQEVYADYTPFGTRKDKPKWVYGITAPIGLTASWQHVGLFVQAIDLGNLVGHYLWIDPEAEGTKDVHLREVFSPGVSFLYNIPKIPLVAFATVKGIPLQKEILADGRVINNKDIDIGQVTIGVKIDIPIFHFLKNY